MDDIFKAALQKTLPGRFKQKELAEMVNISVSYFNDLYKGRKSGQESLRRTIAGALGYDDYEAFLDVGRRELGLTPLRPDGAAPAGLGGSGGFFKLPFTERLQLSAAPGGFDPGFRLEGSPVVVHGPSLGRKEAGGLRAFRLNDASMEPLLAHGGVAVVDLAENDPAALAEGRIYLLNWDREHGEGGLRRLKWAEKGQLLALEAENPSFETMYKRLGEVRLLGRLIMSCREHN